MTRDEEVFAIAKADAEAACAAARLMANRARGILLDVNKLLAAAGDTEAAERAAVAITACSDVLEATHDGPRTVFACTRGDVRE